MTVKPGRAETPARVLKFGGSSLGSAERLAQALSVIERELSRGPIAVVVSAFGHTTDELLESLELASIGEADRASLRVERIAREAREAAEGALVRRGLEPTSLQELVRVALEPLHQLLSATAQLGEYAPSIRDRVLAFGELLSAELVTALLRAGGLEATVVDARTWLVTDDVFGSASAQWPATQERIVERREAWLSSPSAPRRVSIHTGFIGATGTGRTTTLGRNGSDYTAALLARGLCASEVSIFTDVTGVMTADPSLVQEAYRVPRLSHREALELASLGLSMLHPRTVIPLVEGEIVMRVRHTMRPDDEGTLVDSVGGGDPDRPTCIASLRDLALVHVEGTHKSLGPSIAARVHEGLRQASITPSFAVHGPNGSGVAVVIPARTLQEGVDAIETALAAELRDGSIECVHQHRPVAQVTLVAEAMGKTANVAGRFFRAVGDAGINVLAAGQGATSRAISCIVDELDTALAVRALHTAFNLSRAQVNLLVLGKGTVGRHLLQQVATERDRLRLDEGVDVRLAGLIDTTRGCIDTSGIDPRLAIERLSASEVRVSIDEALERVRHLPAPILVDCTAAEGMASVYRAALERGLHVVTANKKPLCGPMAEYLALIEEARSRHRSLRYETTVGASLPVIETLKNLVRTGDRVHSVEGSLSGTLGFLSNAVAAGGALSRAVEEAKHRGYTEPHPREDLTGADAARKAIILARELGFRLELDDVHVEPFVSREVLGHDNLEAFGAALRSEDARFAESVGSAQRSGGVLRYLARIDAPHPGEHGRAKARVAVHPVIVQPDHPAARLRGTEAMVAFHTERYAEYPLVVQGAGAGGAVTGAGVLADILAIAQGLRGR